MKKELIPHGDDDKINENIYLHFFVKKVKVS